MDDWLRQRPRLGFAARLFAIVAAAAAVAGCVDLSVPIDPPGPPNDASDSPPDAGAESPPVDAAHDPEPADLAMVPDADTLANGLSAYWALDEKQGSRFDDRTGLAGPGYALEGATFRGADLPAPLGAADVSALQFDGAHAYATLGVQGLPSNGDVRTIALWFNLAADATRQQDFISLTDGTATALNLGVRNGLLVAAGWGGSVLVSTSAPTTGSWHHVAYSFDKQLNRLYLDGTLMAQGTATPQQGPVSEGWLASSRGRNDFFDGALDDIRIYDRALEDAEVALLANGSLSPPPGTTAPAPGTPPIRNLVGYWKLDETDGSGMFADSSGNGLGGSGVRGPQPSSLVPKLSFPDPGSLAFAGNQCVDLGNPAALNFSGVIALTAWVNISTRSGTHDIVTHGPATNETGLRLDGDAYVAYTALGGAFHKATFPIPSTDVGSWVHLAGVYDGTTWRVYRNGAEVGAHIDAVGAQLVNGSWSIGGDGGCAGNFYRGSIDDVRIYHGELTGAEVARIAAGTD